MRITNNNFYNRFVLDQQGIKEHLDRLTRQISSGMKIQYGYEDPQIFSDTLRLDYEERTLTQAVEVAADAQNFANNTDSVMFQFTDALTRFKTLLIQASNASNAESNYYALANELKSLKQHMINLGNSSINGRFLFSGNKLDVKPLDDRGEYYGNGTTLKAVVGAEVEVPYNIPGLDLFFGEDSNFNRVVTTNVALMRQDNGKIAQNDTSLAEVTGSTSSFSFTIQGRTSEGKIFYNTESLAATDTMQDLLNRIESAFGSDQVAVSLENGYIQVRDKKEGRSHLDFHIYGLAEDGSGQELALVKSPGVDPATYANNVPFEKIGQNSYRGNMPQLVLATNEVAAGTTRVQETVEEDLSGGVTLRIRANGVELSDTLRVDETTTFQQLMNDFDAADVDSIKDVLEANGYAGAQVELDRQGRLRVEAEGLDSFEIYEDRDPTTQPKILFNTNDALTVDDPKHDLFTSLDAAIEAVAAGLLYPDGNEDTLARNAGIENALARIDHVMAHVEREHTRIGAMSHSLNYAVERSETLRINVQSLRSDILDTDIGEASVKLNRLSLNYQALMASIAKVQNLSLVNYM